MGVRIQELPETTGINKEDVLIVEDGQGTKKGTVQQLDESLGVSQLKEDLTDLNEHLEVKKCYLNYDSFTTDGYYYNNNLVPTVGANFKIAEPIKLNAGIYTFYGINLYWTFAKTSNGTITRLGEGYSSTVTFNEEVTVYTTTERGASTHYQQARVVDGESALSEMPDVGIISSGMDTRLQNCEKILLDNASDLNILNESVGAIKCYLNYNSFGSENFYYNNRLIPTPPADGNTYAIAEPVELKEGTYTFYGINLYWTFYVTGDGTITRLFDGDGYQKTITFDEDVTVYTTIVKLPRADYERAMIVDGENVIAGTPNVGIIDTKMNQKIKELTTSNSYTFALFENACACGDSFTQGSCVCSDGSTWKDRPWFDKIAKKCGIDYLNCGIGGSTTRTWLSNTKGLQKVLAAEPYDFYTLAWGINDLYASGHGLDYLGTINDITDDYTQNPDTFYGNYARIIEQIKAHSPNAKFVMFPVWYNSPNNADVQAFNTAIQNIANHYSIPYINIFEDDFFTSSEAYTMLQGHPSALGYMGMASAIERLFDKCVKENINYFRYSSVG